MSNIMDSVNAALDSNNLNFTAELVPVVALMNGRQMDTKLFAPVRTDTNTLIAQRTFSTKYHPIQNRDAFKLIGELSDLADIRFANIGSWGNGAGVYAQIALGDAMTIGNDFDKVERYLTLVNSHDGSRALSILITPFRLECKNQIAKSVEFARKHGSIMRATHTMHGEDHLKELADTIKVCDGAFVQTESEYQRLAETKVDGNQVREAMARMLPYRMDKETHEPNHNWVFNSTAMVNRFFNADDGHVETMTGWNLYNAIQGTFQHDSKNTKDKDHSILMGSIASKSAVALREVEDIVFNPSSYRRTTHPEFDHLFQRVAA